jgi:hypothetical protein
MSNSNGTATAYIPAPTTKVAGTVAKTNDGGVLIGETWFNYGRTFKGTKLAAPDVGSEVELTLVTSKRDQRQYIRSLAILAVAAASEEAEESAGLPIPEAKEVPVMEEPAAAIPPATEAQKKFASELSNGLGINAERLDLLCSIRFGTAFSKTSKGDGDTLIKFLMGGGPAKPRQGQ